MTDELRTQALEEAIIIAIANGWIPLEGVDSKHTTVKVNGRRILLGFTDPVYGDKPLVEASVYGTIFDHNFAKALWGDKNMPDADINVGSLTLHRPANWKWHLQQMVIADDPLEYLADNVTK
jgi:hypothetical protein